MNRGKTTLVLAALFVVAGCASGTAQQVAGSEPAEIGVVRIQGRSDGAPDCYRAAARGEGSEEAAALCTQVIESSKIRLNRTASHVNRGVIHYNGARYVLAAADFDAVIAHGTKLARVYVNRGLSYEQIGRGEAAYDALAKADYERALELQPTNAVARRRLDELAKPRLERTPLFRRMIAAAPYRQVPAAPKSRS